MSRNRTARQDRHTTDTRRPAPPFAAIPRTNTYDFSEKVFVLADKLCRILDQAEAQGKPKSAMIAYARQYVSEIVSRSLSAVGEITERQSAAFSARIFDAALALVDDPAHAGAGYTFRRETVLFQMIAPGQGGRRGGRPYAAN